MWCGQDEDGPRNATVMPPGRLDRSPCGTGSSARFAVMHRRRQAKEEDKKQFRSTIGTRFETAIVATARLSDGRPAILPRITDRA
jgi:proline racemase